MQPVAEGAHGRVAAQHLGVDDLVVARGVVVGGPCGHAHEAAVQQRIRGEGASIELVSLDESVPTTVFARPR